MKKNSGIPELILPSWRGVTPQLNAPELSMDDYYKVVVMLLQAMPCGPAPLNSGTERFLIRDDGDEYFAKKP